MKKIIIGINIIVLIISSIFLIDYLVGSKNNKDTYKEISQLYDEEKTNEESDYDNKIQKLKTVNRDIVAWIDIPEVLQYPIVQAQDNIYYLDQDIHGNSAAHGSIFMDYRNDVLKDENIIIYGHYMRDGTMFGNLKKYKREDYFKDNQYIYLDIGEKTNKYKIFSAYITEGNTDYLKNSFLSKDEFLSYIEKANEKSLFKEEHKFSGQDRLITLSTCTYEYKNARMVIHGYLVLE